MKEIINHIYNQFGYEFFLFFPLVVVFLVLVLLLAITFLLKRYDGLFSFVFVKRSSRR
ncbi:hypothetical protein VSVS05_00543 [Vibrio scophthalmi]|uniref:Uncharacterized protein n=1 Tax=Vibrio scophthalmi TaxID=45658 RepID=A0A1C7F6U0_9VIBR|nr:hypothetical protein VSVS05_00543 [Vibrio scophthalmi]